MEWVIVASFLGIVFMVLFTTTFQEGDKETVGCFFLRGIVSLLCSIKSLLLKWGTTEEYITRQRLKRRGKKERLKVMLEEAKRVFLLPLPARNKNYARIQIKVKKLEKLLQDEQEGEQREEAEWERIIREKKWETEEREIKRKEREEAKREKTEKKVREKELRAACRAEAKREREAEKQMKKVEAEVEKEIKEEEAEIKKKLKQRGLLSLAPLTGGELSLEKESGCLSLAEEKKTQPVSGPDMTTSSTVTVNPSVRHNSLISGDTWRDRWRKIL